MNHDYEFAGYELNNLTDLAQIYGANIEVHLNPAKIRLVSRDGDEICWYDCGGYQITAAHLRRAYFYFDREITKREVRP